MKWVLLVLFGGLGTAALAGGVLWGLKRQSLVQQGVRTSGRVVAQEETASHGRSGRAGSYHESRTDYYPVVEFVTEAGETVRFTGSTGGGGKPIVETGTEVEVIYDPAAPSNVQIVSFSQFWLGPLVAAVCGLIFLIMGTGGFFLIGGHDRDMDDREAMMHRERLIFMPEAPVVQGTIIRIEERPENSGRHVFICRALRPDSSFYEEFASDYFPFDPGHRYLGRQVDIRLDPADRASYYVNIDPLLPEIVKNRGK